MTIFLFLSSFFFSFRNESRPRVVSFASGRILSVVTLSVSPYRAKLTDKRDIFSRSRTTRQCIFVAIARQSSLDHYFLFLPPTFVSPFLCPSLSLACHFPFRPLNHFPHGTSPSIRFDFSTELPRRHSKSLRGRIGTRFQHRATNSAS